MKLFVPEVTITTSELETVLIVLYAYTDDTHILISFYYSCAASISTTHNN
jgi:hypothetical protein